MKEIVERMPSYDYIYLGDNARAPYGPRSYETVYRYTLEAVNLFSNRAVPLSYSPAIRHPPKHCGPYNSWTSPG